MRPRLRVCTTTGLRSRRLWWATTAIMIGSIVFAMPGAAQIKQGNTPVEKPANTSGVKPKTNVITQQRLAAAKALMVAMGAQRRFDTIIQVIAKRLAAVMRSQHAGHAKTIDDVYREIAVRFAGRSKDALGLIAPLYAEKFTTDELNQALAFYSSPLGRKFVSAQSDIVQRSHSLGVVWGGRIGRQMQRAVLAELIKRGIDLTKPAKPKQ